MLHQVRWKAKKPKDPNADEAQSDSLCQDWCNVIYLLSMLFTYGVTICESACTFGEDEFCDGLVIPPNAVVATTIKCLISVGYPSILQLV